MTQKRKHHPASKLLEENRMLVVQFLRDSQKMSFGKIGNELGFSRQNAHKIYKKAVNHFNQTDPELHDSLTLENGGKV